MPRSSGKIEVLHVDDEPDFTEVAVEFLERQDERFDFQTAKSGSEGLNILSEHDFDCVVSDFDMPRENGIEFLEAVRETDPDLPFILYTGKGSEEVASEAISAGVTDYLQKETGTSQYEVLANRIVNAVEQHRAREEAVQTEQRLQTIAENTNDILWKFSADWNELLFVNSPYEEIWGRSIAELNEEPGSFLKGIDPEDRDHVREAMEQLSSGESVDIEYRVNADENYGRWVWVQGEPVFDDDGEVERVVGFARDVTERKAHERKLSALHEVAKDLTGLESIHAVCERTVEASKEILAFDLSVIDLEEQGMLRKTAVSEDIPPENMGDMSVEEGIAGKTYRTGESFVVKDVQSHEDANPQGPYNSVVSVAIGEHGTFQAAANAADAFDESDLELAELLITHCESALDRIEREQALQSQNDRMEYALDRTDSIIFEIDVESGKETRHGPFTRIFGIQSEEVDTPETFYSKAVHPEDRETVESKQRAVLQGDVGSLATEYRTNPDNGDIRWIRASMGRIASRDSTTVIGLSTDITPLKRREAELQRQNERLEKFGSVVSHDLRNPLNVAEGRLELAAEDCDSKHLDAAAAAHDRMNTLIEDLLSLAHAGETVGETEDIELPPLIDMCWSNVETKSADLVVDTDARIQADQSRLQQLFENLFRNAVDHGGSTVTVTVGELLDGFYVEDDGPGVPASEREIAFEPGYSTIEGGTGFGLSIVRDIAEAHGWTIDILASETGGVRFEITGVTFLV